MNPKTNLSHALKLLFWLTFNSQSVLAFDIYIWDSNFSNNIQIRDSFDIYIWDSNFSNNIQIRDLQSGLYLQDFHWRLALRIYYVDLNSRVLWSIKEQGSLVKFSQFLRVPVDVYPWYMHIEISNGSLPFNNLGEYCEFNEFLHIARSVKHYKVNRPNGVITLPPNWNLVASFIISVV